MTRLIWVTALCLIAAWTGVASAHSGGTNAAGCHNDHVHGGYHCH